MGVLKNNGIGSKPFAVVIDIHNLIRCELKLSS